MIPPEVLNRKSLFSLLYKIDQDLAEGTRVRRCPFAGVRCIAPITGESLEVGPRIFKRLLRFASACAAAVPVAVAVCCRLRFDFGIAGFTGPLCCCWSVPFARDKNRRLPLSDSRRFAGYGVQPSSAGSAILETFSPRASVIGACLGICCLRSRQTGCRGPFWRVFTLAAVIPRRR